MTTNQIRKSETKVRTATSSDVAAIVVIANEAFAVETFLSGTRTSKGELQELMREGLFLVGEDPAGRVVASVYVKLRGDRGYFGMLAVDPQKQGRGLGRLMTEAAETYCRDRGCTEIDIRVLSLRAELPPLYRRLGYIETGSEEFHPTRPLTTDKECHCIIMTKRL